MYYGSIVWPFAALFLATAAADRVAATYRATAAGANTEALTRTPNSAQARALTDANSNALTRTLNSAETRALTDANCSALTRTLNSA